MLFYPADFTFICPTEPEEAALLYDKFRAEGAEIIGVSTDTVYAHKAWQDSRKRDVASRPGFGREDLTRKEDAARGQRHKVRK